MPDSQNITQQLGTPETEQSLGAMDGSKHGRTIRSLYHTLDGLKKAFCRGIYCPDSFQNYGWHLFETSTLLEQYVGHAAAVPSEQAFPVETAVLLLRKINMKAQSHDTHLIDRGSAIVGASVTVAATGAIPTGVPLRIILRHHAFR